MLDFACYYLQNINLKLRERLKEMMKLAPKEFKKFKLDTKRIMTRRKRINCLMKTTRFWSCL